ncbi:uncharacterized protein FA14DRAFT_181222 [Meira miltonrushii]|uniref:Uncharacterized protein n=1 Tax=Meira miltonrushii TaxID=1280837 RepID=A0A316V4R6_9BASI|nr:uncharacterized protein FA14DRAFT_181222 [Meira miltonrushii]PWN32536.1 hypothetical protein FA14DRAFT_181222 [Meira miltonrushii]
MKMMIFRLLLFLTLFSLDSIVHAASFDSITTPREKEENQRLVAKQMDHKYIGLDYLSYSTDAQFAKEKWQARKERTTNCLVKSLCKHLEKYHSKVEEANEKVGRMHISKSNRFEDILDSRVKDYKQHNRLLEQLEERNPKADSRHRRTQSFRQHQSLSSEQGREPEASSSRHRRTQSH